MLKKNYKKVEKLNRFLNKLKSLRRKGLKPIIIKVLENVTEQEAFDEEIRLIAIYGRADKNLGPLTNMTDGGEGAVGLVWTKESKENLKKAMDIIWENKIYTTEDRAKIANYTKKSWIKRKEFQNKEEEILNPNISFCCEICQKEIHDIKFLEIEERLKKFNKFICKSNCANKLIYLVNRDMFIINKISVFYCIDKLRRC